MADKKNPYLLLIDNCLLKLSLKYGTPFKYEVSKVDKNYSFTIFQDKTPIFHKEVPEPENDEIIDFVHYEIVRDFFIGGVERIFMQIENGKKTIPKDHSKLPDASIKLTKGKW